MADIYSFLAEHEIEYERYDHPPVFTVEDVNRLIPSLPGAKTKNLFLYDGKGRRHFLVSVGDEKMVDLKGLKTMLGVNRLTFCSPERLKNYLGVDPGCVSALAIMNDRGKDVELVIDKTLWESDAFQFHPLVNTSTLVISKAGIKHFAARTDHQINIVDVPDRK
ncbi:prolyl-tRNA synthetase associated domain-containing protein [Desulfococcaceae bacterium HSG8]|nr:prolyl-tRNA synthetase associated domain-containing protein [Desulfococcaceae bacterium HSG8]